MPTVGRDTIFESFGDNLAASSLNDEVAVEFNVEFHRLGS
jgi:hypothetical protein